MATSKKSIPSNDERAQKLIEIIQLKKKEIEQAEKPQYRTNCMFNYTEGMATGGINLQVQQDLVVLVNILSFLNNKEASFDLTTEELGLTDLKFTWQGHSVADWKADIQTRINKIQIKKKKDELAVYESKLNNIISPERKAQMELDELERSLAK